MRSAIVALVLIVVPVAAAIAAEPAAPAPQTAGRPAAAKLSPALASLVEAERAFSRRAGEIGVRAAFLEYFAEDSIGFEPDPGPAIPRIREWPDPPRPIVLSWEPVFADISRAEDMGYTTGPTLSRDVEPEGARPDRHGYYFSVWRKQPDGKWKVVIDVGIRTPGPEAPQPELRAAGTPGWAGGKPADVPAARAAIFALEREVGADAIYAAEDARLHRSGIHPVLGRDAIVADLESRAGPTRFEPADAIVAASADLAYTYGAFTRASSKDAPAAERGYYTHVWKRAPSGEWRIVAQIEQAS